MGADVRQAYLCFGPRFLTCVGLGFLYCSNSNDHAFQRFQRLFFKHGEGRRHFLCGSLRGSQMTSAHGNIQEDIRLLRLLDDNPELSQRQMAVAEGMSVGGVHYALKALERASSSLATSPPRKTSGVMPIY